jgi:hypothetical protein
MATGYIPNAQGSWLMNTQYGYCDRIEEEDNSMRSGSRERLTYLLGENFKPNPICRNEFFKLACENYFVLRTHAYSLRAAGSP